MKKQDALDYHSGGRPGKLEVVPTKPLLTQRDLSLAYSPGVAEPCRRIAEDPGRVFDYTAKGNLVAVCTNGTAVLGLGPIGPLASKPVMEGKSNLFKKFADIDCFDIELDAPTPDAVVAAVKAIAPTFGGINLEDIKAPDCFEVERRLQAELDIPVFHDDQHGTAIISGAALLNACRVTGRDLGDIRVVFAGAGAAAIASAELYVTLGVKREHIWMLDLHGLVYDGRPQDMFPEKQAFAQGTTPATLAEVIRGKDVFVGLSAGGILSGEMVQSMASRPIIFALANPDPEISYDDAKRAVPDALVATGRSDFPNQVNNVLGFPFLFRGALDCRATGINARMKAAAVQAIAELAQQEVHESVLSAYGLDHLEFGPDYLIPKPFDPRVLLWVAPAVARAAMESGVARAPIEDIDAYRNRLERLMERSREVIRPMINRARHRPRRIVFPDGTKPKVIRAARILVDEGICQPVLLGEGWKIHQRADAVNIDLSGIEIVEVASDEQFDDYAERLWAKRQRKGMTLSGVRQFLRNPTAFGAMMVDQGRADGLVGGHTVPYADTIRPALKVLGADPGAPVVSGVYAMLLKDRRLFFGDCTVNANPDAETLAQIAVNTAHVARAFGDEPRVAMLSFSDFGEHRGEPTVDKVRAAVARVRELWPDLPIDGEMQADTAVDAALAAQDFPFSDIAGSANVLIFPDLQSGNIAYKLLSRLGGATALGPILVGLARPVAAMPLGCSVDEIVNMATITVNQALDREQRRAAAASGPSAG
ncbi:MAG: phosphate acetyltransferase [Alphaproteobacteria bacterium]|nr:phosphate acetyltransferase [Alphaproteobacteria bacterium]